MSKTRSRGPIERAWHASLLLLGSVIAIALTLQVLAQIWGWLLLVAAIIAACAAGAGFAARLARRHRDDW